jgi:glucosyl-3-phosphoglycerate synthase
LSVSVCIPVRNEASTVGPIVDTLIAMRADGLLDQVVVVDATSSDGSASIAARRGAEVFDQSSLLADYGPVKGKGDAIWRSLTVLTGDVLCFFDGDLTSFSPSYVLSLAGALLSDSRLSFVKAAFSRPFRNEDGETAGEGGRVTDALARPMLELFYPALCDFRQPLSGQFAASRKLLASLPMSTGYGIDIGLLIDVYRRVGLGGMGEVDIGQLYNAHQTLEELEPMSYQVGLAIVQRLEAEGRLANTERSSYTFWDSVSDESQRLDLAIETRPPLDSFAAASTP